MNSSNGDRYLKNTYDCRSCHRTPYKPKVWTWHSERKHQSRRKAPHIGKQTAMFSKAEVSPCTVCGSLGPKYGGHRCRECERAKRTAWRARRRIEDPEWHAEELRKLRTLKAAGGLPSGGRDYGKHDNLTSNQWQTILEAFDYTCVYCGERGGSKERDHVVPHSKGGFLTMGNIVPACGLCNRDRSTADFAEYAGEKYEAIMETLVAIG